MTKPSIITFEEYDDWDSEPLQSLFDVHPFPDSGDASDLPQGLRDQVRALAFKGHSSLGADEMDAFPSLGLIANYGVGYDTIDVGHATSRGIKVTNTPDVLTDDVADLAVGMLIALSRDITGADNWVRSGKWAGEGAYPLQRTLSGQPVGIAGLGRIGETIAHRLQAFNMDIHYFSRSPRDRPGWSYHSDLASLASAVGILIVAVSGGPETTKIISHDVLDALGPDGLLINSARGSTVDEDALIDALQNRKIRGAALDVFNNEPDIDSRFLALDNVLLQPHHSSATRETRQRMGELQRNNLIAFFDGKPLLTPVT